jgi:hypothetical protein
LVKNGGVQVVNMPPTEGKRGMILFGFKDGSVIVGATGPRVFGETKLADRQLAKARLYVQNHLNAERDPNGKSTNYPE